MVDPRVNFLYDIENPLSHISNEIGEKPLQIIQDFELPTVTSVIGDDVKEAKQPGKTTILIRRRKMRKHKLRKFRKRMKFTIMKKRQRLLLRREKEFQARLIGQIKETEKFSAEAYVTEKLEKSKPLELEKSHIHVWLPTGIFLKFLDGRIINAGFVNWCRINCLENRITEK